MLRLSQQFTGERKKSSAYYCKRRSLDTNIVGQRNEGEKDREMRGRRRGEVCKLAIMPDLPFKGTHSNSCIDTQTAGMEST